MESFTQLLSTVESSILPIQAYDACVPDDELSWENCLFPDHKSCEQFYIAYGKKNGMDFKIKYCIESSK
ncbi:hypothetical protein LIER_22477 [Lithospermum erythrorhizon]|uniref:Uncharacterized protein n=1 Tax=Lithospermum erythrorhizon TaxID=34254 RepID=A0AAV3QWK2_LITER